MVAYAKYYWALFLTSDITYPCPYEFSELQCGYSIFCNKKGSYGNFEKVIKGLEIGNRKGIKKQLKIK